MHIIGQNQYAQMSPEQTRQYLVNQLDLLQQANCNAIIWQIRPQADAAYVSDLEPWSRWLTGEPGKAPQPVWDPLQFMIDETHRRGMDLHAWLSAKAARLRPGESGLMALDWWNGNRSVLADFDLSGLILGMTLSTRPEAVYRALIEATAYGARTIVENFEAHGLRVRRLYACCNHHGLFRKKLR